MLLNKKCATKKDYREAQKVLREFQARLVEVPMQEDILMIMCLGITTIWDRLERQAQVTLPPWKPKKKSSQTHTSH